MEKLGIQPMLLLAQFVNFAIVVLVLTKLLYKPILSILEKRKKEIEEGVGLTHKLREEEIKFGEKREKLFAMTRKEAQQILEEARKQAKVEEREILEGAHKEAEGILQKGKDDVASSRLEMEKAVRSSAVELAMAMAKRLLTGVLSTQDQHKLIGKQLKDIDSMEVS